jgi:hypothetical protein
VFCVFIVKPKVKQIPDNNANQGLKD